MPTSHFAQDESGHPRAEEEPRERERKLTQAARVAHLGYWEYDFDADRGTGSDECWRMLGLAPQSAITLAEFQQLIHPDDRADQAEAWAKAIRGPEPFDTEHRVLRPNGDVCFIHAVDDVLRDLSGRAIRMFGVWQDITELKRAQEKLVLFRSLLDQSNDAIEVLDPETGRFLDVNQKACVARGFTREEYLAMEARDLDPTLTDPSVWAQRLEDVRRNGFCMFEGQHRRKDGSVFPVEINVTNIRMGREYLLAVVRDITERKLMENQAKSAEEALRGSLREKEALLKEVHHRVKNNLQVITSFLRLEARRRADPGAREVLKDMQGRIMSMALLHETLYRTGNFERIDLGEYLRQLAEQLFRAQNSDPSKVRLAMTLASVPLNIDRAIPCGHIAHELLSNTLKHAFPDGRSGEVRLALTHQPGRSVCLHVEDTGVGLAPDFETRRAGSLGLQIVGDLVRQLGGQLEIGSGPGARFSVVFPDTSQQSGETPRSAG